MVESLTLFPDSSIFLVYRSLPDSDFVLCGTASSFVFFVKALNVYEDFLAVDFDASIFLVLGVGVVV